MKNCYSIIQIFLYLSIIRCNNIKIESFMPSAHDPNMNTMVDEISRVITAIERNRFKKDSYIKIILPTVDNKTMMPEIMEKTVQKLGTNWLVSTDEEFCCDSYEFKFSRQEASRVMEHEPNFYIIPLKKQNVLSHLDSQITKMSEENSFNPRAIFLIITVTHECGIYKVNNGMTQLFDRMWAKNCLSNVILVLSECDFKITIITAAPFSDTNVCRKVQENGTKKYHSEWHEEELDNSIYKMDHMDFNKCQFSLGSIPSPPYVVRSTDIQKPNHTDSEIVGGIDLELLNLASTKLNFIYVFDVRHGYNTDAMQKVLPNGSVVGILSDLLQKNIDIFAGGIIPNDINYYKYDYTGYYMFSSFCWIVNDASLAPQWKIFSGAFSQDVWIIFVVVFIVTSCLYSFLDHFLNTNFIKKRCGCNNNRRLNCNFQAIPLIKYFSIILGSSSMLKPNSTSLRVLFFSWSIYSLHMCIAYSSMLFLLMSNPPLEKEIKTVNDLKVSGLKVGSKYVTYQRFATVDLDNSTRSVMDHGFVCPGWETCVEALIKNRNFSLLIKQDMLEFYINTKQSKVHRLSEAFFSYGTSVMTSEGNPLAPGLNSLILVALQAGLFRKWDTVVKSKFKNYNIEGGLLDSEESTRSLRANDLKGTFIVLIGGIAIALLSFFGELVVYFLYKK